MNVFTIDAVRDRILKSGAWRILFVNFYILDNSRDKRVLKIHNLGRRPTDVSRFV